MIQQSLFIEDNNCEEKCHSLGKDLYLQLRDELKGQALLYTTPLALGYVLAKLKPRLCIAAHNKFDEMSNQVTYDEIRKHYDGDVILAKDLQAFNISKDRIVKRLAVVPELAWPYAAKKYQTPELPPPRLPKSEMMEPWLWERRIPPEEWTSTTPE